MTQIWSPLELELMSDMRGDFEMELRYLSVSSSVLPVPEQGRSAERPSHALENSSWFSTLRGISGPLPLIDESV